jgi:multidrug resistance efflux pump
MNEAATRLESARTELERQESLRNQKSTAFSSSEMARARLAARLAEIQLEQLPKPPGERLKAGFKP